MPDTTEHDTAQVAELLEQYGLSAKEAETYLAVVERGSATVSTVADAAGVSTSFVYDAVDDLEQGGFVTVEDHRTPTEIRAEPPAEAFGTLKHQLETVESVVSARYQRQDGDDDAFEVVKSRPTIVKRLEEHIDAAEDEVILQVPANRLGDVRENLRRARQRGVLVLLTLCGDTSTVSAMDLDGVGDAVRVGLEGAPSLLAVDQTRGFVCPATMLSWDHDETRAITFTQPDVAAVLVGSYLGNYWPIGEEVLVSRPPELPQTFERFRSVVFAATLALWAGEDVVADLYVRPTGTDDSFEMLRGAVVSVRQNLVRPEHSDFGFENALVVDTGDEAVSVGGYGAFLEEYECKHTTLETA